MLRHTAFEHHVSHRLDDTEAVDAACPDRQAFPSELVDQGHQLNLAPIMGLSLDEVVAPDMIAMLRPQADARSVVQPEPAARSLLPGYFKPPHGARSAGHDHSRPASRRRQAEM